MIHAETTHAVSVGTQVHTSTIVRIGCGDPLLVRADRLVLDQSDGHLGAIVDGILSHLGQVTPDIAARLVRYPHAIVESPHFTGGHVRREVPVVVH